MTDPIFQSKYRAITISGKAAVGTTTLAKSLEKILGWQYINAGALQRQYDREHNVEESKHGALIRSDEHEREIDEIMAKKILEENKNLIYEAWLGGFMAQGIKDIFKVLVVCTNEAIRIDRVANRDNMTIDDAKKYVRKREEENIIKWKKLYGDYDFWDTKYYDLVIDTYSSGPLETVGKVLDKLGYKEDLSKFAKL